MGPRRFVKIFLLALPLVAFPAAAQSDPPRASSEELADDLRGIRLALERLVALEEAAARHRELDLLFKRIELRERRLEPLSRKVDDAEEEVDENGKRLDSLDRMREQLESRLSEEIRDGSDAPRSETRRKLDDVERSQLAGAERLKDLRAHLQQLEADLARRREDIEELDEMLSERIEALER